MSDKKYLDYEGLQRYDANWLLEFEAMALNDDDLEDVLDEAFPKSWSFTVNTEATETGEKKTGIPFNLYGQNNIELTVDWGDGTTSTLISSNYTQNNSEASVHEYSNAGEYTVTIISNKWKNTYFHSQYNSNATSSANNSEVNLYWFKRTLISIDSKLPKFNGCYFGTSSTALESQSNVSVNLLFSMCEKLTDIPSDLFDNNPQLTQFQWCFYSCSSLQSIPSGLFDNNTAATNFSSCFVGVNISSIPSGLFDKNTAVTNFSSCFSACSSLTDFTLHIGSSSVSNCSSFVTNKSGTTRTIYVPSDSTTQTTFNAVASSLGLTIIGV